MLSYHLKMFFYNQVIFRFLVLIFNINEKRFRRRCSHILVHSCHESKVAAQENTLPLFISVEGGGVNAMTLEGLFNSAERDPFPCSKD